MSGVISFTLSPTLRTSVSLSSSLVYEFLPSHSSILLLVFRRSVQKDIKYGDTKAADAGHAGALSNLGPLRWRL